MSGKRPPLAPIGGFKLPTILVMASDDVQRICAKNNLRFCDLLKPLGFQHPSATPTRLGARFISTPSFGVRFVSPEEMDAAERYQDQEDPDPVLGLQKEIPPDRKSDGVREVEDVAGFLRVTPDPTPWFTEYRAKFVESLAYSETDYLDHPIGCIIAVSTQDESPMKLFDNMRAIRNLPKLFQKGHYDSNIYRTYVLVHDASSELESKHKSDTLLAEMEKTFAQSSAGRVITLNSRNSAFTSASVAPSAAANDPEELGVLAGLYRAYAINKTSPVGTLLSASDVHQITAFIGEFITMGVTPALNKKLLGLQEKVAAVRRGFRNQVKLLFKGRETKPKAVAANGAKTHLMYDLTSAESQIRQLADFSFLLKDYEQALSSYRLVAHDYKSDKAWGHYAGAQEMMGLCLALTNGSQRDMSACFDAACSSYYANGDLRRAARVVFSAGEALLRSDRAREATLNYLRASEKETGVRGALMIEQAAYAYLHIQPRPLVRKYSFHLVMAGHQYHKSSHNLLGVRCYQSARSVYEKRDWVQIEDYLNYHLGRDCFNLKQYDAAVHHFVQLIGQNDHVGGGLAAKSQSIDKQKSFLSEFVFVVKSWCGDDPSRSIPDLRLPTFLDTTVTVLLTDAQTVRSSFATGIWTNVLKRQPPLTVSADLCNRPVEVYMENFYREKDRVCGVNERIEVEVTVSNPLLLDIVVKNIRLSCVYVEGDPNAIAIEKQDLFLQPGQVATIRLGVTCNKKGNLRIEGILWEVCETINGYHPFVLPDRRTLVKEGNHLKTLMKPTHDLNIPIIGELPLLHYAISDFPTSLYHGEVVDCVLTLSNRGSLPLRRTTVFLSHPMCMVFRKRGSNGSNDYHYRDPETSFVCEGCFPLNWESSTVDLDLDLAPGQSVELDLTVRGALLGKQNMCILFRYAMDPDDEDGNSRLAIFNRTVMVEPLVNVSVFSKHSFAQIYDSVLGMEIEDRQNTLGLDEEGSRGPAAPSVRVDFTRVSMLSESWKLRALGSSDDTASMSSLTANESLTVFFRVSSIENGPVQVTVPPRHHHRRSSSTLSSLVSSANSDLDVSEESKSSHSSPSPSLPSSPLNASSTSATTTSSTSSSSSSSSSPSSEHSETKMPPPPPLKPAISASNLVAADLPSPVAGMATHSTHSFVTYHESKLDVEMPPYSTLLKMEKKVMIEEDKNRLALNPAAVVANVGASDKLDMVLTWSADGGKRHGFYHLIGLSCLKSQPAACSLKVLVNYAPTVTHDFKYPHQTLTVPVEFQIRNLEAQPVSFLFETLAPEEEFDYAKRSFKVHNTSSLLGRYLWGEEVKRQFTKLPPNQVVVLPLTASFSAAGHYNLNRFRLNVQSLEPGGKSRVFFWPLQHLIHVQQA